MNSNGWISSFMVAASMNVGDLDFKLTNKSGHDFQKVWIAVSQSDHWLLVGHIDNGGIIEIKRHNEGHRLWDLRVEYKEPDGKRRWERWNVFPMPGIDNILVNVLPNGVWNAHFEMKKGEKVNAS
jgi:hypothetical protein